MVEEQDQDKPLVVQHFQDAVIGPSYGVFDKGGHPIPLGFLSRGKEGNDFPFGAPTNQDFAKSGLKHDPRSCLWIRFAVFWHFGHLITETLANLWPLLEPKNHLPDHFIVVIPDAFRQDIDKIKSLAGQATVLCNGDLEGPTCFAQVLIAEPSCVDRSRIHPEHLCLLQLFRNWLIDNQQASREFKPEEALRPNNHSAKDKLYLSRSRLPQSFRKLIQEQQLEDQLIEAGWTILYPEKASLEHQLELLSKAKIIAGQWGSAFHLLMACPEHQCEQVVMLTMDHGAEINFTNQFQLQKISATFLPCLAPIGKKGGTLRDLRLNQSPLDIAEQIIASTGETPRKTDINEVDEQHSIELHPGKTFCSSAELNRISRQQGLCLAIAQASVYDEICQTIELTSEIEQSLVEAFLDENDLNDSTQLDHYLLQQGWSMEDLVYFATKQQRLVLFQKRLFQNDIEIEFLTRKTELDTVRYSLIRVRDGNLAFELHQRLLDGEADFRELASTYSEGSERESRGQVGPVPLDQANPVLVDKLRAGNKGQLWKPFFVDDIWVILRLDEWSGARLDDATRQHILRELFNDWVDQRTRQLLNGDQPDPLPLHRLNPSRDEVNQGNAPAISTTVEIAGAKTDQAHNRNAMDMVYEEHHQGSDRLIASTDDSSEVEISSKHDMDDIKKRINEIDQLIRNNDPRLASQKAERLAIDYPKDRDVLLAANRAHRLNGDYTKAFRSSEQLIHAHPDFLDGYVRAAQASLLLHENKRAIKIISQGFNIDPNNYWILLTAIKVQIANKNFARALKLGGNLRKTFPSPDDFDAIQIIAQTLRRTQRFEECRWHLYNSIQKISNRAELRQLTEEIYHLETQRRQQNAGEREDGCDVLCLASEEGLYIHEFIHHYIYLGFKNIFIGIYNCTDNTVKVAEKIQVVYPQVKIINVNGVIKQFRQWGCYHRLFDIALQQSNSKHCLIVDIDEFWIADQFPKRIDEFINNNESFDAYSFHWVVDHTDNMFGKPFDKNLAYIKDSRVKSLLSYSSPLTRIDADGPILNMSSEQATVRVGHSTNVNIKETMDGVTVDGMCINPQASTPEMEDQAWIVCRTFRSELEYAAKAVEALETLENEDFPVGFKTNRYGWANTSDFSGQTMNNYVNSIMPSEAVEKYHLSLEDFIQSTEIKDDLDQARSKITEQAILDKLSSIERSALSRNSEILKKIFAGTRFLETIQSMIN